MFGIGMPEMIVILIIALIIIGPKKLPDLAKSLGKAVGEFKKAVNDFKDSVGVNDDIKEVKKAFGEINHNVKDMVDIGISRPKEEKVVPAVPHSDAIHAAMPENNFEIHPDLSTDIKNRPDMPAQDSGQESKDKENGSRR